MSSSGGFLVITSPEGLEKRSDAQVYLQTLTQTKDIHFDDYITRLKNKITKIIYSQEDIISRIGGEEVLMEAYKTYSVKDPITLKELENIRSIGEQDPKTNKIKRKDFVKQLEHRLNKDYQDSLDIQQQIKNSLAAGKIIDNNQLADIIAKMKTYMKNAEHTQLEVETFLNTLIDNNNSTNLQSAEEAYNHLNKAADKLKKGAQVSLTKAENGRLQISDQTFRQDAFFKKELIKDMERNLAEIRKYINQGKTKKEKQRRLEDIKRNWTRRKGWSGGKELNIYFQSVIDGLVYLMNLNASPTISQEDMNNNYLAVRQKVIEILKNSVNLTGTWKGKEEQTFYVNKEVDLGERGYIEEEIHLTIDADQVNKELIKSIKALPLGDMRNRTINKHITIKGNKNTKLQRDLKTAQLKEIIDNNNKNEQMVVPLSEEVNSDKETIIISQDVQNKIDNLIQAESSKTGTQFFIAFSDKFRNFYSLSNLSIMSKENKQGSLLSNADLLQSGDTEEHALLFAILNNSAGSIYHGHFQNSILEDALSMSIMQTAFNQKDFLKTFVEKFEETSNQELINDIKSNTLYVFSLSDSFFVPVYQVLRGVLKQLESIDTFSEIVTSTISYSSCPSPENLYQQSLEKEASSSDARWSYVAKQVAETISINTSVHFDQLLQLYEAIY